MDGCALNSLLGFMVILAVTSAIWVTAAALLWAFAVVVACCLAVLIPAFTVGVARGFREERRRHNI